MKPIIVLTLLLAFFQSFTQVKVRGYHRKDGTYVRPHYRSSPDGNPYNNYSYPGNTNPYTGQTAGGNASTYLDNYYNRSSSGNNNSGQSISTTTWYVNADRIIARRGPSHSHAAIAYLKHKHLVEVVGSLDETWCQARFTYFDSTYSRFQTVFGYFETASLVSRFPDDYPSKRTENYSSSPTPGNYLQNRSESAPPITLSNNWYVNVDNLFARTSPSSSAEIITTLSYKQIVEIAENSSSSTWCQARFTYFDAKLRNYRTVLGYVERAYLTDRFPENNTYNVKNTPQKSAGATISNQNTIINPPIYASSTYSSSSHPYGAGRGQLTIWTNCNECGSVSVYINDSYAGTITACFKYQPDCTAKGVLSVIKPAGTYTLKAICAGKKWEGIVNVGEDKCSIQLLSE